MLRRCNMTVPRCEHALLIDSLHPRLLLTTFLDSCGEAAARQLFHRLSFLKEFYEIKMESRTWSNGTLDTSPR